MVHVQETQGFMIKRNNDLLFMFDRHVISCLKDIEIQEFSQFLDSMNTLHQFFIFKICVCLI